jgi:hypothetical protein
MKSFTFNRYDQVTVLLIAAKILLHLLTNSNLELHRDELLYFNMADHLSFGYATVPPLTAFLAFLSKTIFGFSVAGIRLFPALAGALTMLVMSKIIKRLGGGVPALTIALLCYLLSPGFLLINALFTPNAFEHLMWTLVIWLLLRMITEQNSGLWIAAGIVFGLSFLFKYSVLFLIAGFAIAFMPARYNRFLKSWLFLGGILAGFLIILPNIIWQQQHNWPVINHMSELNSTQLKSITPVIFLTDLLSLNLASTTVWLFGMISLLFFRRDKAVRFFGISSLVTIILFVLFNGKGYYVMGLIPFLFAAGGCAIEKSMAGLLIPLRNIVLAFVYAVSVIALPTGLPLLSLENFIEYREKTGFLKIFPFYRWEGGEIHNLSQVYADMTGWTELTGYTAAAYYMLSQEEREACSIFSERNYGYAGAIHFYGKVHDLPESITFHESYTLWAPDTIPLGPLIYLSPDVNDMPKLFGEVIEIGSIRDPFFRESGLKVFLCREPTSSVQELYRKIAVTGKDAYR